MRDRAGRGLARKTKAPEPSGKTGWKTGFVLHCPNPRILFTIRMTPEVELSAGPFSHSPNFGQRDAAMRYPRDGSGTFMS